MKKMMILTLSSVLSFNAVSDECALTEAQQSVVHFSYSYGKGYDLGYTMVAIAMQESDLGRWNINLQDPSAGPWHVTLDKGLKALGWKDTGFNRNRVAQRMMNDYYFSAKLALDTLLWWRDYHNGDWRKMVSSYNGGHKGNPSYMRKIANNIKKIKMCKWVKEVV